MARNPGSEVITNETLRILEAEGIGPAINMLASLLESSDGLGKYGRRAWKRRTPLEHYEKAVRHMCRVQHEPIDTDSGLPALAHVMARVAFLLVIEGEEDGDDR